MILHEPLAHLELLIIAGVGQKAMGSHLRHPQRTPPRATLHGAAEIGAVRAQATNRRRPLIEGVESLRFAGGVFLSKFIYNFIIYNVLFFHLFNLIFSWIFGCQDFSSCGCWALRSFPLPSKSSLVTNSWP